MIKPFQSQQLCHRIPLNRGAQKVFDEAAGAGLAPEIEDRYEDVAADFLEKWLVTPESSSVPEQPAATPQEKDKIDAPTFEPQMSSFQIDLDWQLSDGRRIG